MNDDRDADLVYMLVVLPLAVVACVGVWAAFVWIVTRFGS